MDALALYIHFPWCVRKCPYCDFNSHPTHTRSAGTRSSKAPGFDEPAYLQALISDLDTQLDEHAGRTITTVFCGGGTPSLFSPASFERLIDHLAPRLDPTAEITMEANPGTTEHHDLGGYRAAGINRLSLGVQSFDEDMLNKLGRIHGSEDVYRSFELARSAGFDNINLDLMYGLPDQDRPGALGDLIKAIELAPEHLSWYQLTLEPKTEFARRPPTLPSDIILEAMEREGYRLLEEAGFIRYEVSAFARPGHECLHNMAYWTFGDYLGAGAGAHGKISRSLPDEVIRTRKPHQPRLYLANSDTTTTEVIAPELLPGEFMLNALRLAEGVAHERFEAATGLPLTALEPMLSVQIERGLMRPDRLAATDRGYAVLDSLIQAYL